MNPEEDILLENKSNDDLYEHHRFIVDPGQTPLRIDKFLVEKIANSSRNKIQIAAQAGTIYVNDKVVKSNHKVRPSDIVTVLLSYPKLEFELIPQDIPIEIVYEDEEILIVNKAVGMVVHPSYGHREGTLINAVAWHLKDHPMFTGDDVRPGLVHRIDKDTSGLLVIGKSDYALTFLGKQFFDHTTKREYHALVWGNIEENSGTITGYIGRSKKNRKVMAVYETPEDGKHAVTHYEVLEKFSYVTLVKCKLETGRTHQIRAHFAHIGHPLFNDATYGGDKILKGTIFTKYNQFVQNCFSLCQRQALHAKSLGFVHPKTKEDVYFDSEMPEDMSLLIEKWRKYSTI